MNFDWSSFLINHGVDFTEGRRGVNIQCPFCKGADHGQNLGIDYSGKGWYCWRNREHRGRSPVRLIQALTGCSFTEAQRISGMEREPLLEPTEQFVKRVHKQLNKQSLPEANSRLRFTRDMRPIEDRGYGKMFFSYLMDRGYTYDEMKQLIYDYDLHYAVKGPFSWRLIIPVYMPRGLMTWTARAIGKARLRYRTLSDDEEASRISGLPRARAGIGNTLFNGDTLFKNKGSALVITEGPFDAMRVDFFGRRFSIRSTCLFTKSVSSVQLSLLESLADRYQNLYLMLDKDAGTSAMRIGSSLRHLGIRKLSVGEYKDPAEIPRSDLLRIVRKL